MQQETIFRFVLKKKEKLIRRILMEGGLAGHLSHLYENKNLTFGDLKEVIQKASQGKLEEVTEKLDGQNIFFSYNEKENSLKFARNKGDVRRGGMSEIEVTKKWLDKPAVQTTFTNAFKVLTQATEYLSSPIRVDLFGEEGDIWYSAEIVSSFNPNVIN